MDFPERLGNYGSPYVLSRNYFWTLTKDGDVAWEKIQNDERIVGRITCEQEAMPCVYIDVRLVGPDGKVLRAYQEETRMRCSTVLLTPSGNEGEWLSADYFDGELEEVKTIQTSDTLDCADAINLVVTDPSGLLKTLEYELGDLFP